MDNSHYQELNQGNHQFASQQGEEELNSHRFQPSIHTGLTKEQVNEQIAKGHTNAAVEAVQKTAKEIVISNVCTYFNLIFAVIAVLLFVAGSYRDLTFLPIIIANTCIGIFQELKSKKTLDKLSVLNTPKARVVRDGKVETIRVEELVLDDIVIFGAGNQICADAVVLKGEVSVNESLITGEQDEITKRFGDDLLSGSFIVSGECYAQLSQVGADSYASKLTLEAKKMQTKEQSEMIRSLNVIVKAVGVIIIPIAAILFFEQYHILDATFREGVTSAVAAVIGMIPEGLYLLTSVALAVSVTRLAQKKVLVHDMKCIETLARVNVLCVDKTGTITEPAMKVENIILMDGANESMESMEALLGSFTHAMSKDNETMKALSERFHEKQQKKAIQVTSFSSATKYSGVTFSDASYVLGAPEFVLRSDFEQYKEQINEESAKGYRVVVFGRYEGILDNKPLTENVIPLAMITLNNPIRKDARQTFEYFRDQKVKVKVISGDNPVTVSKVAMEAGIEDAAQYVDASTLLSDSEVTAAANQYTVFGRVTPNQKRLIINAIKDAGNTVAMTGDGVNDVLALKDADCSIAMASGSDVAAQAAQLVLLESDFSCMPSVVLEGRRVINNIERSASLFLVKNIFSFLMAIFSIVFMVSYPLTPSQISLISMFTIGAPAFFLALENNHNPIRGHFMNNVLYKAMPAGLTDFLVVSAVVIFSTEFQMTAGEVSTSSTLLMSVIGFMILYRISKPMNGYRRLIFSAMLIGLVFCSFNMRDLFNIHDISTRSTMLLVVFAVASESVFRYMTLLIQKLKELYCFLLKKLKKLRRKLMNG